MKILNYIRDKFLWLIGCDLEKELDDFQAKFPGQCPICAYHRYGVMEGLTYGKVRPHACPSEINLDEMTCNAGTVAGWNYQAARGNTELERFEGLYEQCMELEQTLRKKGAEGQIWIWGPKYFLDILAKGSPRWILNKDCPVDWKFEYKIFSKQPRRLLMGTKSINYMHYARIYISNFPIHDIYQLDATFDDNRIC